MKRLLVISVVAVFLSAAAFGQPQNPPSAATGLFIRAGWVFDGREMLGACSILVRNGKIEALLEPDAPVPPDAMVLDASTCTVLPGFFDGHIHFMGPPLWQAEGVDRYGWGKMAEEGYSLFPGHRSSLLRNGLTSIIEMGSPPAGYLQLRKAMDRGRIEGPEIYFPGPLFTAPNGHPAGTIYRGQHDLIVNGTVQVDDAGRARVRVRGLARDGVDFIKIVYDRMGYTPEGAPRLDLDVARAIVDQAHRLGLRVFAHIGSQEEALAMVEAGVDGIEHSFGSNEDADALFAEMVRRKVVFTPTLIAYVHYAPQAVAPMKETVRRAVAAGVPLVLGTDYPSSNGVHCGDDVYEEMRLLEEAGVSRLEILRAATSGAADKIGRQGELGAVAAGGRANLVFLEGRADEGTLSSDRIARVMLHGRVVVENRRLAPDEERGFREKHVLAVPYFFWDPLTEANFGLNLTDFDLFDSGASLSGSLVWSLRDMWAADLFLALPSPIPMTRLTAAAHFDTMNRLFYGFGNSTKKSDAVEYGALVLRETVNTTTTWAERWKLYSTLAADQVWLGGYGGGSLPALEGREGERLVRLGLSAGFDTRDHEMNPWRGVLLVAGAELSPGFLGTGTTFGSASLDLRGYVSPLPRHVIAGRFLVQQAIGAVPFYYLPAYGGAAVGRGYFPQRFSDRFALCGQLEYRFPIWRILQAAVWLDLGQVQPSPADLGRDFHPAFGLGPRLAFGSNENSILAVDVGFSPEGWALYVRQGLAF